MAGYIFAIVAGAAMSIQGVFNTRLSDAVGLYESNLIVYATGLIFAIIAVMLFGKGDLGQIGEVNKLYLSGGLIGIIITITVMLSMSLLSPTASVSAILISQLLVAAIIDAFGLFGCEKESFGITKIIGLILMIGGILLIKYKK